MAKMKLTGADYLLLLLYLDNQSPVFGAVRLMKMMFLFKVEISDLLKTKGLESDKLPQFFAYNFGPFDKEVYEQIELFKSIGFVTAEDVAVDTKDEMAEVDDREEETFLYDIYSQDKDFPEAKPDGKYMKYQIDKRGIEYVESRMLQDTPLTTEQRKILEDFKKKIVSLYPKQILKYVYTKYPEYTTRSLIKDEVLGDTHER